MLDSVVRSKKKCYYHQNLFEECKYEMKKIIRHNESDNE